MKFRAAEPIRSCVQTKGWGRAGSNRNFYTLLARRVRLIANRNKRGASAWIQARRIRNSLSLARLATGRESCAESAAPQPPS
jgi:hypothetical protein